MKQKVSLVLPCQNEEESLGMVIEKAKAVFKKHKMDWEIIVSDSSLDSSPQIAKTHKVKLIKHDKNGYGKALLEGVSISDGDYLLFADSDGSYDMSDIPKFIKKLNEGYDFVLGNRFNSTMNAQSMPMLHRYIGNPILSFLIRIFYQVPVSDAQCGMRAITQKAFAKLALTTSGMEFASEMVIKSSKKKLKIAEVLIHYLPRKGTSKLRPWHDGLRHLKLIFTSL